MKNKSLTIEEASVIATEYLQRQVSTSNISYLIQYGRIAKCSDNGATRILEKDLIAYYERHMHNKEAKWKEQIGNDLNWDLSFSQYKESDTTKHVHRLHPYKGKFIPQLVEYFLDEHTDNFKQEMIFRKGDIVLDPFCGSGTTLVQANELGIHAIGIDVSEFNALISNIKISQYNLYEVQKYILEISKKLKLYLTEKNNVQFEVQLVRELKKFNDKFFPSPDFKREVYLGELNEKIYGEEKAKLFLPIYEQLVEEYSIELLQKNNQTSFLSKWYLQVVREEIEFVSHLIENIPNEEIKKLLSVILSRTIRSCRATTHADLATLIDPVTTTYYCKKHGKICKPLFSILGWWDRYSNDTLKRISQFLKLRTATEQICLVGDSRGISIMQELYNANPKLSEIVEKQRIAGIFSSPPYVGLIDYHEQHAYSYELFGFSRNDDLEIGPLFKGQGKQARESYVEGISQVLLNLKPYLVDDFDILLVANDKYNLYPRIAELAGMKIVKEYKRPVLNRVEKDRGVYSESIFHIKDDK